MLVGEGAERAFAEHAVRARIGKRQRLGVALEELDARRHPGRSGPPLRLGDARGGELDADDATARLSSQLHCACARPAADVSDDRARCEAQ
jgi:hypothetical protein